MTIFPYSARDYDTCKYYEENSVAHLNNSAEPIQLILPHGLSRHLKTNTEAKTQDSFPMARILTGRRGDHVFKCQQVS